MSLEVTFKYYWSSVQEKTNDKAYNNSISLHGCVQKVYVSEKTGLLKILKVSIFSYLYLRKVFPSDILFIYIAV